MGEKFDKRFANLSEDINKNCTSYAEALKTNLTLSTTEELGKGPQDIKAIVKEALTETKNDDMDIEDRKKNFVMFNVTESQADTADERKKEDISFVVNMTNAICDNGIAIESIQKARRLGRRPEDDTNRPLIITLDSEIIKRKIFSRLYKLRDDEAYSNINVSHDMTLEERKRTKILVDKAKAQTMELANSGSQMSKNWVFKVRGPPWDQRIEKVRIQPQN